MRCVAAVFAGLFLSAGTLVSAQQQDSLARDTLRFRLRPVEVRVLRGAAAELRTPAAVSVLARGSMQDAQLTVGLDEALSAVPGVTVNNRYNFALGTRIAVRGLGARAGFGVRGVRLVQDGIPLTMPDGQANVNNIDLGSAGRIEVLRGPASSLYGNAAGGVVAIETEPAPPVRFAGELRTVAGDVGRNDLSRLTRHQLKVGGQSGRLDYLISGSRMETDGFRTHSRAEQSVLNTRVRLNAGGARWSALLNFADAPTAQNPGSLPLDSARQNPSMAWPSNRATGSGEASRQTQAGLGYERQGTRSSLNASVYGLVRSLDNPLPTFYVTLERKGAGARVNYVRHGELSSRRLDLSLGADLEHQSDQRGEFNNASGQRGTQVRRDQTDRVTALGPFAQAEWALLPRLQVTAGARYDVIRFGVNDRLRTDGRDDSGERTLSALSPRVAFLFALTQDASAYASVGTSFQTPTTTELLNRPPTPGEPFPGGMNDDLEPQRALNVEIGLKGRASDRVRYEAALYQMRVQDALVPFQVAGIEGRDFFRNAGETLHRGFELALTTVLTRWLLLETAYTYSHFTFVDDGIATQSFEDNLLPGVPPHHLYARLRMQPHAAISLEIENEYTAAYFANDANTARNGVANVVDARLQLTRNVAGLGVRPFVAVNNLFDRDYSSSIVINQVAGRYYEPAPGRNLYLGAAIRFGGW